MQSTPKLLEVTNTQEYNNAEFDWYVGMPSKCPLVDPTAGKFLGLFEEEDATQEPSFSVKIVSFHIGMGRNVCWNWSNTMLVSHIQYVAGKSEKKRVYCTTLIT